ncbi:30S ribosomal protein S13 [Candidatus Similichlamydia epinepheli]|uniref:30S ribosomal protein S13 n=1 Tax=Candidatus Similichlamydia epinepheli TaxID=1903953 RepID=UPI000D3A3BBE|nr:30S ribosomal protein S13 [Candidatus Similichlamydia epinepheli]
MVRIVGVDIPNEKRVEISLLYIYGIGPALARKITERLGLDRSTKVKDLSEIEIAKLNSLLQSGEYLVEGDLRRNIQNDIKRLMSIRSYRGLRHRLGLPVRGQRTKTNARTRKGKRKTVANKKKAVK